MFNINIDLNSLIDAKSEMRPNYQVLQQTLVNAATFVRDTWIQAVSGRKLPGMSQSVNDDKYAKALNTGESIQLPQLFHAIVMPYNYTDGVDTIEQGLPAYDMKPSLLNGPKSRPLKSGDGRYNTIPFRHYTPKSEGGGASSIALSMEMPKSIYDRAKKLERSVMNPLTGKVDWGQSLQDDTMPGINSTSLYQHKAGPYQGMYRVGDAGHTQYLTFRRVSTPRTKTITRGPRKGETIKMGSDPRSWIHPSVPGNPVIQSVINYCMPLIDRKFEEVIDKMYGS